MPGDRFPAWKGEDLFECLKREMSERREREKRISDFESFVDAHAVDLGSPYKFARQDAYDEALA